MVVVVCMVFTAVVTLGGEVLLARIKLGYRYPRLHVSSGRRILPCL